MDPRVHHARAGHIALHLWVWPFAQESFLPLSGQDCLDMRASNWPQWPPELNSGWRTTQRTIQPDIFLEQTANCPSEVKPMLTSLYFLHNLWDLRRGQESSSSSSTSSPFSLSPQWNGDLREDRTGWIPHSKDRMISHYRVLFVYLCHRVFVAGAFVRSPSMKSPVHCSSHKRDKLSVFLAMSKAGLRWVIFIEGVI